jgi:peptide deformylase
MAGNDKLSGIDLAALRIIHYPDPRLREDCTPLEAVDESVRALAERMFELMFQAKGVGLAAPQVGVSVCMFVASPTYQDGDRRVYINPELITVEGEQDGDEGCLSFPGITARIKRANFAVIRAVNLAGETFEETGEELVARIFQHETDHIHGRLLLDRMGSVAKLANRRALRELEEEFAK